MADIRVEPWDSNDHIITIDGQPVGQVRDKAESERIAAWLKTAVEEIWALKSLQGIYSKPQKSTSVINATQ